MSRSRESHPTSALSVREGNCSAFPKGKMSKTNVVLNPAAIQTLSPVLCLSPVIFLLPSFSSLSFPALLVTDVAFSVLAAPRAVNCTKLCISTFSTEQIKS